MFYVYPLQGQKDKKFYTGFTNDSRKRLLKHNAGKVLSTKSRCPLRYIYAEICVNEQDARQRERRFKTGIGKRFIKQRLRHYFTENT